MCYSWTRLDGFEGSPFHPLYGLDFTSSRILPVGVFARRVLRFSFGPQEFVSLQQPWGDIGPAFFLCECSTFSFGFVGQSLPYLIRRIGITVRDVPVSTDSRHGLFIACLQINSQQHLLHNFERAAEQMNETVSPKIYQHIDASGLN